MMNGMKPNKKVVAAGHICLDISPVFPDSCRGEVHKILIPGKLVNVGEAQVHIGGSVGNTGLAMAFFGADVRLMGKIGKDEFGEIAGHIVKSHGVKEGLIVSQDSHTSYTVVLSLPGQDRIFLHHPGANDTFSFDDLDLEAIRNASVFHFGYPPLMQRLYRSGGQELARIFEEVSALGVVTSLDLVAVDPTSEAGGVDWQSVLKKTLPCVDIFAPSVEELLFMLDRKKLNELEAKANGKDLNTVIDIEKDVKPLAETALQMGAKVVLIKCGEPGLYFRMADQDKIALMEEKLGFPLTDWARREGFEPSYVPERVLSATGAGDVTIAAFLTALLGEESLEACLQYATAAGACCVTEYDSLSGLKSFAEMRAKIDAGWQKRKS